MGGGLHGSRGHFLNIFCLLWQPFLEGKGEKLDYSKGIEIRQFRKNSFVLISISNIQAKSPLSFILKHQWCCYFQSQSIHSLHLHLHPGHIKHRIARDDHDQQKPRCQENTNDTQLCGVSQCTKKAKMFLCFHECWLRSGRRIGVFCLFPVLLNNTKMSTDQLSKLAHNLDDVLYWPPSSK